MRRTLAGLGIAVMLAVGASPGGMATAADPCP